jgi:hypothetical protein
MQAAQAQDIMGQQVVLVAARVLGLVLRNDREVVVVLLPCLVGDTTKRLPNRK